MLKTKNLGQHSILSRKGTFYEKKKDPNPTPHPFSIPFLKALHQNKVFHDFPKTGHRSIVKRNTGLEYPLFK